MENFNVLFCVEAGTQIRVETSAESELFHFIEIRQLQ